MPEAFTTMVATFVNNLVNLRTCVSTMDIAILRETNVVEFVI